MIGGLNVSQYDDLISVDPLKLYFGDPYVVNQYVTVYQPTIGDIIEYGEREYYSMIQTLTAIPSELKSQLFDMGLDWTKVEDFQLFLMMSKSLSQKQTKIVLGDIDLQRMKIVENPQNGDPILKDPITGVIIDELAYKTMSAYLCKLHNLTKKVEKAGNKFTKQVLIDEDRQKREYALKQPYKSFLMPIISAIKARQGYTRDYIRNMGLHELMTELNRLQIIVNTDALISGAYSGMMDTSKVKKSAFNWLRDIDE
jgi:hypothetical protein